MFKSVSSRRSFIRRMALAGVAGPALIYQHAHGHAKTDPQSNRILAGDLDPLSEEFWTVVRAQFPLVQDRVYFNNGTLGPSPSVVLNSIHAGMQEVDARGEGGSSDATRAKLADFVGASVEEISLTHNTTEGINIVAWGLPLVSGDEVIVTTHEHVGSAFPWIRRSSIDGIILRTFEPADTSAGNLQKISDLINSRTRVIAVPHLSCTTGQVFPIKEIAALARSKDIFFFVDGAHGTGMMPLDLHDLGCDFYASCGHKWLCGPKGTGYLYVRKALLNVLEAKWVGSYSSGSFDLQSHPPKMDELVPTAHRFDYGTQNEALINGMSASIDFFNEIGFENIQKRGRQLATTLHAELTARKSRIEVLTPSEAESRAMVTGFRFRNSSYLKFGEYAASHGFRLRLVYEAGLNLIRVSTHLYNSPAEVEKFLSVVDSYRD